MTEISFKNYIEEVITPLKKEGEDILASLDAEKCDLLHMALGLAGESIELSIADPTDTANIIEELGDIFFYTTAIADILGIELSVPSDLEPIYDELVSEEGSIDVASNIFRNAEIIVNSVKKFVIYENISAVSNLVDVFRKLILNAALLLDNLETPKSIQELLMLNKEKLFTRHSTGKFTNTAAVEKVDHNQE